MPEVWAVLLLLGLGAQGVRGCLQCDEVAREALGKLRAALVPKRFAQELLQAHARMLLMGMEGSFFRDYALNAFVGKVEVDHLQAVASFVKNQSNFLQHSPLKDEPLLEELEAFRERVVKKLKKYLRSYELKEFLREEVVNCLHCQKSRPKCIKTKYCFVDGQPRMDLQYQDSRAVRSLELPAIIISVGLAIFLFGAIIAAAITYRENRKLLLH
ncbi:izumo sperm-egg fusion protein 2 [Sorex araneus]|uniref:izumo sperm-egg fusion protein 2 n=1 Tax=Sorex araneus TaxID=42254 RepID=UPI002433EF9A|nr:izumo sperm-egg fusion protein 2 [Sorex araneus]